MTRSEVQELVYLSARILAVRSPRGTCVGGSRAEQSIWEEQTFCALCNAGLDVCYAFAELLLRAFEVLVGVGQVLYFLVELFLDLG
jgi:hypothetical protein